MGANYKELMKFSEQIERLSDEQKDQFLESCCKELAARLLAKVIKRTPVGKENGGTLRRGWTAGQNQNAVAYANSLNVTKSGGSYHIDIINPVEYASYVEYGHRTRNHQGWVDGHFMLTISENEINSMSDAILQKKLKKFMKDVFDT